MDIYAGKDPIETEKNLHDQQLKLAQEKYAGTIGQLETVAKSVTPTRVVGADPDLKSGWQMLAKKYGLDPTKDFNDNAVRQVFAAHANTLRTALNEPMGEMPDELQDLPGANGQLLQQSKITGKKTEVVGQKLPTYTMEKRWNPVTGRDEGVMVQTSPGGAPLQRLQAQRVLHVERKAVLRRVVLPADWGSKQRHRLISVSRSPLPTISRPRTLPTMRGPTWQCSRKWKMPVIGWTLRRELWSSTPPRAMNPESSNSGCHSSYSRIN